MNQVLIILSEESDVSDISDSDDDDDSDDEPLVKKQGPPTVCIIPGLTLPLAIEAICRAYPGSEFVVANTLAKWKKLEPNELDFSQDFSQKVVSIICLYLTLCPLGATLIIC